MRDQALTPPQPREIWKTFDAAAKIDNASLRLLRELAAWRLDQAMERNQSPYGILSDGLVVKLARMQPESRQSLQDDRRIPDRLVRRYGDDVVRLTELAAGSDEDLAGSVARIGTESWTRLLFLNLCVDVLAQRESWAAKLVLPTECRVRWALEPLEDRQQVKSMLAPWRDALVGEVLSQIGQGKVAASSVGGAIKLVNSLRIDS
jgi:ribonuclease D